jgi:ankyrin repeat protein
MRCSAAAEQLWKACKDGNLEGVRAVVNNTPHDQRAALLRAEDSNGLVSLCLVLRPAVLPTECVQFNEGTGLHIAAALNGHTAIVSYLIDMGAEVDVQDSQVDLWSCSTNAVGHCEHVVFRMVMSLV